MVAGHHKPCSPRISTCVPVSPRWCAPPASPSRPPAAAPAAPSGPPSPSEGRSSGRSPPRRPARPRRSPPRRPSPPPPPARSGRPPPPVVGAAARARGVLLGARRRRPRARTPPAVPSRRSAKANRKFAQTPTQSPFERAKAPAFETRRPPSFWPRPSPVQSSALIFYIHNFFSGCSESGRWPPFCSVLASLCTSQLRGVAFPAPLTIDAASSRGATPAPARC